MREHSDPRYELEALQSTGLVRMTNHTTSLEYLPLDFWHVHMPEFFAVSVRCFGCNSAEFPEGHEDRLHTQALISQMTNTPGYRTGGFGAGGDAVSKPDQNLFRLMTQLRRTLQGRWRVFIDVRVRCKTIYRWRNPGRNSQLQGTLE